MQDDLEYLLGQTLAGFHLTHLLGAGGMAVVFRGENKLNRKLVRSIKIVRPEFSDSDEFRVRFASEAMMLEQLQHPNVVRFYGLREGHIEGEDFLVMELEYLEGQSLGSLLLRSGTPPSLRDVTRWMYEAGEGVAAAHAMGVVHRDLKPDNIFLTKQGDVKVLDFGVARAIDESKRSMRMTRPGTVQGSPAYLAPEICDGGKPAASADVYALGISLVELALGYHPFEAPGQKARTVPQMMFAHLHEPMPKIRASRPEAPASLETFIAKATAKKPKDRFADASEFARGLAAVIKDFDEPAPAHPKAVRTEFAVPKMYSSRPPSPADDGANERPRSRTSLAILAIVLVTVAGAVFGAWPKIKPLLSPAAEAVDAGATTEATPDAGEVAPSAALNTFVRVDAAPAGLVLGVPAGTPESAMGFRPDREITAPLYPFEILAHEVTWAEVDPFLAQHHPEVTRPSWVPAEADVRASLPATGLAWAVARAYCRSLEGDLPTEEEWELAARGASLRPFPWGDSPLVALGTHAFAGEDARVRPVMTSPQDRTPEEAGHGAVYDLAGNAREWTRDLFRPDTLGADAPAHEENTTLRALRGLPLTGSLPESTEGLGVAHRSALCAEGPCPRSTAAARESVGFRCTRPAVIP